MSSPVTFTAESKRQLIRLLIETMEGELAQREEELLDVMTRPPPNLWYPHYDFKESEVRVAISGLMERLKALRNAGDAIPDTPGPVVEVFSVVQTRQAERDTWYFITPCVYSLDRTLQLGELSIRACDRRHFLMGTRLGHTYTSGGHWNDYTGEVYEEPLTHHVVGIF